MSLTYGANAFLLVFQFCSISPDSIRGHASYEAANGPMRRPTKYAQRRRAHVWFRSTLCNIV
ncbi:hypothetical protein IscW_ISCW004312 [Ixodes scapularis]|uniref:Uncharacterized protein n=1 Tax=Ixodes scapularis TaxID=6945 RepID=B7PF00_IXOSC|nr:hypothetical protein IscW_ISCW004312 [Ixodes scapularis]|eukprot:XP_002433772.1 hypothetical protein IscW_ISCW004312 [Ixodes scapularis]